MTTKGGGMKKPLIGAGLLASLGAVVLLIALFGGKVSPRDHITKSYRKVSAGTYQSSKSPLKVAGEIAGRHRTEERIYTPDGVFLRYHNVIVGILPNGRGSRITLDTPERGYHRYHSAVGTTWGGPGGNASYFRGGGPGGGGK